MLRHKNSGKYLGLFKNFGKSICVTGPRSKAAIFRDSIYNCIHVNRDYENKFEIYLEEFLYEENFIESCYNILDFERYEPKGLFESYSNYEDYLRTKIMKEYDVVRFVLEKRKSAVFNLDIFEK